MLTVDRVEEQQLTEDYGGEQKDRRDHLLPLQQEQQGEGGGGGTRRGCGSPKRKRRTLMSAKKKTPLVPLTSLTKRNGHYDVVTSISHSQRLEMEHRNNMTNEALVRMYKRHNNTSKNIIRNYDQLVQTTSLRNRRAMLLSVEGHSRADNESKKDKEKKKHSVSPMGESSSLKSSNLSQDWSQDPNVLYPDGTKPRLRSSLFPTSHTPTYPDRNLSYQLWQRKISTKGQKRFKRHYSKATFANFQHQFTLDVFQDAKAPYFRQRYKLAFLKRRSRISEIVATKDIIFGLSHLGVCTAYSPSHRSTLCFLNISPDEVIRSLFYNKANDSLITVSVYRYDNYSSLKCRSTPIEFIRRKKPEKGYAIFESESLRWPGFVEFDDVNGKVLTYSAANNMYKVWNLSNYTLLYTLDDEGITEIKISPGVMLLIYGQAHDYVPLRILSVDTGNVLLGDLTPRLAQACVNLNINPNHLRERDLHSFYDPMIGGNGAIVQRKRHLAWQTRRVELYAKLREERELVKLKEASLKRQEKYEIEMEQKKTEKMARMNGFWRMRDPPKNVAKKALKPIVQVPRKSPYKGSSFQAGDVARMRGIICPACGTIYDFATIRCRTCNKVVNWDEEYKRSERKLGKHLAQTLPQGVESRPKGDFFPLTSLNSVDSPLTFPSPEKKNTVQGNNNTVGGKGGTALNPISSSGSPSPGSKVKSQTYQYFKNIVKNSSTVARNPRRRRQKQKIQENLEKLQKRYKIETDDPWQKSLNKHRQRYARKDNDGKTQAKARSLEKVMAKQQEKRKNISLLLTQLEMEHEKEMEIQRFLIQHEQRVSALDNNSSDSGYGMAQSGEMSIADARLMAGMLRAQSQDRVADLMEQCGVLSISEEVDLLKQRDTNDRTFHHILSKGGIAV
eukprot:g3440.t1